MSSLREAVIELSRKLYRKLDPRRLPPGELLALAGGMVAMLFSLVLQWPGAVLSADGWAYWEGSLSLLAGEGYRYLDAGPIVAWPPGFSAYLALWQLVFGVSAGTLVFAHAFAIGVAAAIWIAVARRLVPAHPSMPLPPALVAVAVLLAIVLPICLRTVLSESLFMVWLGAAIGVTTRGDAASAEGPESTPRGLRRTTLLALLAGGLMLTRHVGVAFLPALLWLEWRSRRHPRLTDRTRLLIGVAAAVGLWFAVRVWLGLLDNNPRMSIDANAPAALLLNMQANLVALVSCFLPKSLAGVAFVAVLVSLLILVPGLGGRRSRTTRTAASALPAATLLAAGCAAVTWALFGVSGRRIVLPVAAMLILVAAQWGARSRRRPARRFVNALLIAFALVQLGRVAYWGYHAATAGREGLSWSATLVRPCSPDRECVLGPNDVVPPDYPWIDRRTESAAPISRPTPPR